jgi:hypothetical protein
VTRKVVGVFLCAFFSGAAQRQHGTAHDNHLKE